MHNASFTDLTVIKQKSSACIYSLENNGQKQIQYTPNDADLVLHPPSCECKKMQFLRQRRSHELKPQNIS